MESLLGPRRKQEATLKQRWGRKKTTQRTEGGPELRSGLPRTFIPAPAGFPVQKMRRPPGATAHSSDSLVGKVPQHPPLLKGGGIQGTFTWLRNVWTRPSRQIQADLRFIKEFLLKTARGLCGGGGGGLMPAAPRIVSHSRCSGHRPSYEPSPLIKDPAESAISEEGGIFCSMGPSAPTPTHKRTLRASPPRARPKILC